MNEIQKPSPSQRLWLRAVRPRTLVAAAAAAVLMLGVIAFQGDGSSGNTAWAAELVAMAERSPQLLIGEPGWEVVRADEYGKDAGEMTFTNETYFVDLRWIPVAQHEGRVEDRRHSSGATWDMDVVGLPSVVFQYRGTNDFVALWRDGDLSLEIRGMFPDVDSFRSLVATLEFVDVNTWLSSMPDSVVKPDGRAASVDEMLADMPVHPSVNVDKLKVSEQVKDRYQLGAEVTGAVACAWINQWVGAKASGDKAAAMEAVDAMSTSHQWAILIEMDEDGDYPEVIWEYADAMVEDASVSGGRPMTIEEAYRSSLGCPGA